MRGYDDLAVQTAIRKGGAARFHAIGLPTRRVEDWKYSDLRAALGENGLDEASASWRILAKPESADVFDLAEDVWPDWVYNTIGSDKNNALSAASLAFARTGVAIRVSDDPDKTPLSLEISGKGNLRIWLMLEPNASLTFVEHLLSQEQLNIGVDIFVNENCQLNHIRLAPAASDAVQVEEVKVGLGRDARYYAHNAAFGSKLSRLELDITLAGEGAEAHLSGVSVLGDETHADITTHVTHAVARTASTQLFKKVAAGKSRAVYQGKVTVAKGADGADSRQTAKALLLGPKAEADLKPELEIFADDVKCAHGAAVGDLDTDSLFYLRARGLPEAEARALLLHAFLEDAFVAIARDDLREQVRDAVNAALDGVSA